MRHLFTLVAIVFGYAFSFAQSFDMSLPSDTYRGKVGELIKVPVRLKNNESKTQLLVLRKTHSHLGSTQKSFFCLGNNCLDPKTDEQFVRIEPGQTVQDLFLVLEAGLTPGLSSTRLIVFNRNTPAETSEYELNFTIDEAVERSVVYESDFITVQTIFPNPIVDFAEIDYRIHRPQTKHSIVLRNLLGNKVAEYTLSALETQLKVQTDDFNSGIYFMTLYIENEGVMTRKLLIKK